MGFLKKLTKPFIGGLAGGATGFLAGGPIGAVIGAGLGGLSGYETQRAQSELKKQNAYNMSLNTTQQNNFENQVQYRVNDALKAGINPLFALGMSSGYQPNFQQVGGYSGMDGIGSSAGAIGQTAGQLANAFMTRQEQKEVKNMNLQNMKLQNDYLQAQIDHLNSLAVPGRVAGGRGFSVSKGTPSATSQDWIEGDYPGSMILHTAGGDMVVPSEKAADALDVEFGVVNPYAWEYAIRDYGGRMNNWVNNKSLGGRAYNKIKRKITPFFEYFIERRKRGKEMLRKYRR